MSNTPTPGFIEVRFNKTKAVSLVWSMLLFILSIKFLAHATTGWHVTVGAGAAAWLMTMVFGSPFEKHLTKDGLDKVMNILKGTDDDTV